MYQETVSTPLGDVILEFIDFDDLVDYRYDGSRKTLNFGLASPMGYRFIDRCLVPSGYTWEMFDQANEEMQRRILSPLLGWYWFDKRSHTIPRGAFSSKHGAIKDWKECVKSNDWHKHTTPIKKLNISLLT